MKLLNKILIGLLSGTILFFVGYSLIKGTYSNDSLTFSDVVDEIDYTLSVDTTARLIEYLETGKSVSQILEKMPINSVICDKNGEVKENTSLIVTGDIVTLDSCSNASEGYTLSVLGDVNGSGGIDWYDIIAIYYHKNKKSDTPLTSAQVKAGDVAFLHEDTYISVDKDSLKMIKDDEEKISYVILPPLFSFISAEDVDKLNRVVFEGVELEYYVPDKNVTLSSNDTNVVNVDASGVVTSSSAGNADVTIISSKGPNVKTNVAVEVTDFKNAYDQIDVEWVNKEKLRGHYLSASDRVNASIVVSNKINSNTKTVVLVSATGIVQDGVVTDNTRGFSDGYVASALAASLDAPILIVPTTLKVGFKIDDKSCTDNAGESVVCETLDAYYTRRDYDKNDITNYLVCKDLEDEPSSITEEQLNTRNSWLNIADRIIELGTEEVYVVGGTAIIPDQIVGCVSKKVHDKIHRVEGDHTIETSVEVAKKVFELETNKNAKKQLDIFITKYDDEKKYVDAASVSFVSADEDNPKPILYVKEDLQIKKEDGNLNSDVWDVLNTYKNNINKVYVVGGTLKTNIYEVLKGDTTLSMSGKIVHISGNDGDATYSNVIDTFYTSSNEDGKKPLNGVVIVNGYSDIIYSSRFAAENKAIVMYHGCDYCNENLLATFNNKPYELSDSNLGVLLKYKDSLENIYFRMSKGNCPKEDKPEGCEDYNNLIYRNLMYKINSKNVEDTGNDSSSYINDIIFSSGKAVFYVPSQGNEILYFSQAISAAVNEIGAENVYVVLLTAGENSGVRTDTDFVNDFKNIFPNGMNLTEFVGYRDGEMLNALSKLGISDDNLYTLDELISSTDYNASDKTKVQLGECTKDDCKIIKANLSDYKRLKDSGIKHADVINLMVYFETSKFGDEGVSHFLFSPYIDNLDKNAMGYAAYRHYLTSETWFNNVYLVTYGNASGFDDKYSFELNNNKFNNRIKNAVLEYKMKENYSKNVGGFGIGYASANTLSGNLFDNLVDAANNRALETKFYVFNKPIRTSEIGYNQ